MRVAAHPKAAWEYESITLVSECVATDLFMAPISDYSLLHIVSRVADSYLESGIISAILNAARLLSRYSGYSLRLLEKLAPVPQMNLGVTTRLPALGLTGYKTAIVLLNYILMINAVEVRIMFPTTFKISQNSAWAKIYFHTRGR